MRYCKAAYGNEYTFWTENSVNTGLPCCKIGMLLYL